MKKMSAWDAMNLIKDGDTIAVSGFLLTITPRELLRTLEKKFLENGTPKNLTIMHAAGCGDNNEQGIFEVSYEGLVSRYITGHFAQNKRMIDMTNDNKVSSYNFPQGVISNCYRSQAAGLPGHLTKIGLKTFCDPRLGGGRMNDFTKEQLVKVVNIDEEEFLYYQLPKVDVAFIRGSTADEKGNISLEDESAPIDGKEIALAAKANGGKVIVQVKNYVAAGAIDRTKVTIPGTLVDAVVVSEEPFENHRQTPANFYDPAIAGHYRVNISGTKDLPLDAKKVIARRAAMELKPASVVNLGIGIPELVALVANEEGIGEELVLTIECGLIGGVPLGGKNFGSAVNSWAALPMADQFLYYNGNGLDCAFLGFAEVNEKGDINVSKFGQKIAGVGGFIDISQPTKNIYFCGTFTAGGLKESIDQGKIIIEQEGKRKKFLHSIDQITFSSDYSLETDQNVKFITERAVFNLTERGLELIEIAPGIDLQKDILDQMDFQPILTEYKEMDGRIFKEEKMRIEL